MKKFIIVLILLCSKIVMAQNYTEYATGNSADVNTNHQFGVCLMGGASENDNAMIWFLEQAAGGDVVVLRASGSDGYNDYMYSELGVTINSVTTFVINNEAGALDPYVLDKVNKAEAIWFAGGDQFDYVSYFKDNAMEAALNQFVNEKQGVIGGTSAGMAILGSGYFSAENGTVTNAQALSNPYHNRMTLGYNDFLNIPFLNHVITDTHYDDPDRRARHSAFLARYATDNDSRAFGIACNEYTAVCIDETGRAYVYGEFPDYPEYAFFLQSNCTTDFMPETCVDGQPLTWNKSGEAIKVAKIPGLINGDNYIDLSDWNTSQGAIWENWFVDNGSFTTTSTINPQCDLLDVESFKTSKVALYPNPFQNELTLETTLQNCDVELYDIQGRAQKITLKDHLISTQHLEAGVYFIRVTNAEVSETIKLIKR